MSTVKFDTWQNTDGTENYKCRAWVNFDGTSNTGGNCDIRASGNVSTVADNGVGDYTVNFTTAMPDANYTIGGCCNNSGSNAFVLQDASAPNTTSSANIFSAVTGGAIDSSFIVLQFFR